MHVTRLFCPPLKAGGGRVGGGVVQNALFERYWF